jgi:AcrR family transcriptional regulator
VARSPNRVLQGTRRRAEIIEAAMTFFAHHGYRGASLAAIAEDVNITQPGLLHHFGSKRGLLLAVLEERDRRDRIDVDARHAEANVFEALKLLVAHNMDAREIVKLFTVLTAEAAVQEEHPAHVHFAERYAEITKRTVEQFEQEKARGDLAPNADSELISRLLLAMMDGLQIQWLLDPSVDMYRAFSAFVDLLAVALSGESADTTLRETPTPARARKTAGRTRRPA